VKSFTIYQKPGLALLPMIEAHRSGIAIAQRPINHRKGIKEDETFEFSKHD
jgi:hypothetical protein